MILCYYIYKKFNKYLKQFLVLPCALTRRTLGSSLLPATSAKEDNTETGLPEISGDKVCLLRIPIANKNRLSQVTANKNRPSHN